MKYRVCIWLIRVLLKRNRVTLREIQDEWITNGLGYNISFYSSKVLKRYIEAAEQLFSINIYLDSRTNQYFIEEPKEITESPINKWILQVAASIEVFARRRSLSDRILLGDDTSNHDFITPITEAMHKDKCVKIKYYSYWMDVETFTVEPYFIKFFKQHWYLIGFCKETAVISVYAFERMKNVSVSEEDFNMKHENCPHILYRNNFGIIDDPKAKVEDIYLRFTIKQAPYIMSTPLHHSQEIVSYEDGYMDVRLSLKITSDFIQELLSYGPTMKILGPQTLVNKYKETLNEMYGQYNEAE